MRCNEASSTANRCAGRIFRLLRNIAQARRLRVATSHYRDRCHPPEFPAVSTCLSHWVQSADASPLFDVNAMLRKSGQPELFGYSLSIEIGPMCSMSFRVLSCGEASEPLFERLPEFNESAAA